MLSWKDHKEENKCFKCGKMRYVEVINDDSEIVTTKVAHKHLCYMHLTLRLKGMFLSKSTVIHMRWHIYGERENK
jgi:hypothetical protein